MLPKDPLDVAYIGPYMSYSTLKCYLAPHVHEVMSEAVGDVSYDTRAVGRSLGRLQLPRVEHGLCLRALERMGQQWE